jgi:uncharacterized protein involved in exopolysaccharide biosynthesis
MENNSYEEISLREVIEILLKGKKVIIAVTFLSMFISAIFSFFIIDPTYEASITLMASAVSQPQQRSAEEGLAGILDSLGEFPIMTVESYKEQIKNPVILQKVIDQLKLDPKRYNRESLEKSITLETVKNTNLIKIKARDKDPHLAADIANTLARIFTEFISEKAKERASKSYKFLEKQMNVEKEKLDSALVAYKEFLAQPRGVNEIKNEVDSKLKLVTTYKTRYIQKEIEYKNKKAALEQAIEELQATDKILVTNKSISDNGLIGKFINGARAGSVANWAHLTMKDEQINPNYLSLKQRISSLKIELKMIGTEMKNLKQQINKNAEELKALQSELAEKQHQERLLKQNITLAQQTYDSFLKKYEEIRIAQSSQVGDASIIIVAPAMKPILPVAPHKTLNIVIAGVLGMMTSVFVVLFKEYWENAS